MHYPKYIGNLSSSINPFVILVIFPTPDILGRVLLQVRLRIIIFVEDVFMLFGTPGAESFD